MTSSLDLYSTVALIVAIITLFIGVAAITNTRRLNEQKHQRRRLSHPTH